MPRKEHHPPPQELNSFSCKDCPSAHLSGLPRTAQLSNKSQTVGRAAPWRWTAAARLQCDFAIAYVQCRFIVQVKIMFCVLQLCGNFTIHVTLAVLHFKDAARNCNCFWIIYVHKLSANAVRMLSDCRTRSWQCVCSTALVWVLTCKVILFWAHIYGMLHLKALCNQLPPDPLILLLAL
jgi:hypothetical protein